MGTMPVNKNEQFVQENHNLNLAVLEEKVNRLVTMLKSLKLANQSLQEENQMLKHQLMRAETSLVEEAKGLEDLSQENMMARLIVDDLIKSIDSLVEQKE